MEVFERSERELNQVLRAKRHLEKSGVDGRDAWLDRYASTFFGTPVFSHLTYAVLALTVAAALALRHRPADIAMIGLMLSGMRTAMPHLTARMGM